MRTTPPARRDAGALLARALLADAGSHGLGAAVVDWHSHPWASATFVGARHRATLRMAGDPAHWIAALPGRELSLRDHVVADLVVRRDGTDTVVLDALTLDSA